MLAFKIWQRLGRIGITKALPDELVQMVAYRLRFHRACNLDMPKLFTEKIQWLMLYNHDPQYTQMVDKYKAKEYVASIIGEEYITPTLASYKTCDEIDFKKLPDSFVLKCTHDSGDQFICKDKEKICWPRIRRKYNKKLRKNYYECYREWPYKDVEPRIIIEEYLENNSKEGLHDYKVWCFNGEAKYVQYITGRLGKKTYEAFFDKEWNQQNFSYHNPILKKPVPKPPCLDELFEIASKLAKEIPFVRIDFYILPDNTIRFGEITFYPMVGLEQFHPQDMDEKLGNLIDLSADIKLGDKNSEE